VSSKLHKLQHTAKHTHHKHTVHTLQTTSCKGSAFN